MAHSTTAVDITERKRIERDLERSEDRLVNAQRVAQLGSWELDIETDQQYWSEGVYQILGLSPGDVAPTYEAFLERVHPEDRETIKEVFAQTLRQWEPLSFEYRVVLPSGEERVIHERNQVTVDGKGKAIRLIGTAQDITERKRIEQELERSKASLDNAQHIARLGSWEWSSTPASRIGPKRCTRFWDFRPTRSRRRSTPSSSGFIRKTWQDQGGGCPGGRAT